MSHTPTFHRHRSRLAEYLVLLGLMIGGLLVAAGAVRQATATAAAPEPAPVAVHAAS